MKGRPSLLLRAALATLLIGGALATPGVAEQETERRIIAIGDIHGAYQPFESLLHQVGLLDEQGRWSGGKATLVQTGDIMDRGVGVRPALDLLMTLERQASAAGGRVIVLLGNHETMNLTRLLQDVTPAIMATFADDRSESRRMDAYQQYVRLIKSRRRELRAEPPGVLTEEAWMQAHPPGFVEYIEAFSPDGLYGRWLRGKQIVAEVDGTVFMHAGLNPQHVTSGIDEINKRVRDEIARFDSSSRRLETQRVILPFFTFNETLDAARADLQAWLDRQQASSSVASPVVGADRAYADMLVELLGIGKWSIIEPDGPLWFRGFASWGPDDGAPQVDDLQKRYHAKRFVVGHTVQAAHEITARFNDRIFLIDTGMLSTVYRGGQPSALEIVGNRVTALYLDRKVALVDGAPVASR